MNTINSMKLSFISKSANESFARAAVAAFLLPLDPTVAEIADVKTAVSEAVTNAIVHGYEGTRGMVTMSARIDGQMLSIRISDQGKGIADIQQAMEPFFTTHPEQERSGMGFAVMQTFMDEVQVHSTPGSGTQVYLRKCIASEAMH